MHGHKFYFKKIIIIIIFSHQNLVLSNQTMDGPDSLIFYTGIDTKINTLGDFPELYHPQMHLAVAGLL